MSAAAHRISSFDFAPDCGIFDARTFREIIDALPAMVNVKDRESRYVFMNAYQAGLYGTTPSDAIGKTAIELMGEAYGSYTQDIDKTVIESGQAALGYSESYTLPDGSHRSFRTTKMPWRRNDGIEGIITIAHDVSDIEASGRALADALMRSEQANHAKTTFLANMSHELRTPLNAVIGFSEVLASGRIGEPARIADYANSVVAGARRLLDVIDDILELARVESGTTIIEMSEFAPAQLVADVLAAKSVEAARAGVELVADIPEYPLSLRADRDAVARALLALVSNAIKFSPKGGQATVSLRLNGDQLDISVQDRGIGMTAETIARCQERFFQAESGSARSFGGLGIGLAVTKALIELHAGSLDLTSSPGSGTRATLRLPQCCRSASAADGPIFPLQAAELP